PSRWPSAWCSNVPAPPPSSPRLSGGSGQEAPEDHGWLHRRRPVPAAARPGPALLAARRRSVPGEPAGQSSRAADTAPAQDRGGQRDRLAPAPAVYRPVRTGGDRALRGRPAGPGGGARAGRRVSQPASGTGEHAAAGLGAGEAGAGLPGPGLRPRTARLARLPRQAGDDGLDVPTPAG